MFKYRVRTQQYKEQGGNESCGGAHQKNFYHCTIKECIKNKYLF